MIDPVFVIHGVANRDPSGFTTAVASLQAASGIEMHPVYWGDLGAEDMADSASDWASLGRAQPPRSPCRSLEERAEGALPLSEMADVSGSPVSSASSASVAPASPTPGGP
ncbi:hypothetical protein AB0D59_41960 [Streptomyces sp. NPDC048417]|uniref:hypothetical protein n=1 Tax=Streptomyces sp. NPDC048417 TaxID=3155387 RepID=UPI003442BC60